MFYVCMYNIDVWLDISIYACGITLGHYAKLCVINLVALLLIYFITHTHKFLSKTKWLVMDFIQIYTTNCIPFAFDKSLAADWAGFCVLTLCFLDIEFISILKSQTRSENGRQSLILYSK